MEYNFKEIEARWQKYWQQNSTFKAENQSDKEKFYVLDMFPYPSGAGLHVGHPLGYIASDIVARYKRHKGFNVLHPMGYDSFGLPAEQYAIQTGQHPAITTEENIARYRQQLDKIGFAFDWEREVRTSKPEFYKFTQQIFLKLFDAWYNTKTDKAEPIADLIASFSFSGTEGVEAACAEPTSFTAEDWNTFSESEQEEILQKYRLAYRAESTVNWCPALGTVLANDEVKDGRSERGGHPVVQKKMLQWSMRISAFAQRLLKGLEEIDWSDSIKETQRNWIGRSEGAKVSFKLQKYEQPIEVFTTRPDTIFGVSFMTLAPENPLVDKITTVDYKEAVARYKALSAKKTERDRMADVKTVSGQFTGAYALHPFTQKPIPVWIGDYVLASYGTGAVMAVPAHDSRDYAFAKQFELPILPVVEGGEIEKEAFEAKEGIIINSDFLNGLEVKEAITAAVTKIEEKELGKGLINYRLRDAIFGRQRYWGEPIPIYYKEGIPLPVEQKHLPLNLPEVDAYLPTEDGEPPLARATNWYYHPEKGMTTKEDGYPLETTTMPGWAGSSWYYLRYMSPTVDNAIVDESAVDYWQNVDLYMGGSEHATGHLLYSRFWHKFLHDFNIVPTAEPFKKLINQGMILGNSAVVYRVEGANKFVSLGLRKEYKTTKIHADVSLVDSSDELDVEGFKAWRGDLAKAEFVLENGVFKVGREVEKMSKRWYNVVNPDDICEQYGADTLRMYEMFLGPLEQSKPWNTAGISGVHNFLKRLVRLFNNEDEFSVSEDAATKKELKSLHTLIKKVNEDVEAFSFNTSISAFMICVNELTEQKCSKRQILEPLTILLSPFAPHLAEELWGKLGHENGISAEPFPTYREELLTESSFEYPVAFNGKMRFKHEMPRTASKNEVQEAVMALPKTAEYLEGKEAKKVIVVPNKIVNIVM